MFKRKRETFSFAKYRTGRVVKDWSSCHAENSNANTVQYRQYYKNECTNSCNEYPEPCSVLGTGHYPSTGVKGGGGGGVDRQGKTDSYTGSQSNPDRRFL